MQMAAAAASFRDVDRLDPRRGLNAADGGDVLSSHAELGVVLLENRDTIDDGRAADCRR